MGLIVQTARFRKLFASLTLENDYSVKSRVSAPDRYSVKSRVSAPDRYSVKSRVSPSKTTTR